MPVTGAEVTGREPARGSDRLVFLFVRATVHQAGRHLAQGDPVLAGPGADDVQRPQTMGPVVGPPEGLAVDGHETGGATVLSHGGAGDPVPEARLEPFGLEGHEQVADAIPRGDAVGEGQESFEPIGPIGGPPANGRRSVAPTDQATHRDHDDVEEQVLAVLGMPGVGQGLEIGTDGFDGDPFGCYESHRASGGELAPRSKL